MIKQCVTNTTPMFTDTVNPYVERQILSDVLLEAKMSINSASLCSTELGSDLMMPSMFCAGYLKGSKSVCQVSMQHF